MARGVNKVILVGNLGADPEVRYTPGGAAVANLRLATADSWMDKQSGQRQERTEWHRVVMFGRLAEIAGEYLRKGSQIYVEGSIRTNKWQDQSGQDRYTTEIVANEMQMLSGRDGGGASNDGGSRQQQGGGYNQSAPQQSRPPSNAYNKPSQPSHANHGGGGANQSGQPPADMGMSIDDMDDIPF